MHARDRPWHHRPLVVVAACLAALTLAACSPAGDRIEVAPIDDILDGDITVEPDPSGTFATLRVTTSIPVACSVAYGTDDTFGLIATDDDMAGGAHADHQPTLDGLSPETTYRYVLQGADANGNLYRSDVMEFTTPPATTPDTPGPNVAIEGTVADVSSEFSEAFAAHNAIDGDPATEWSTAGDGDDASITVDLGRELALAGAGYLTRSMGDGSATATSWTVTVDPDDDPQTFGPFAVGDGLSVAEFTASGRVVRFDVESSTGGNTGAIEVEVYRGD